MYKMNNIPKILHLMWLDKKVDDNEKPNKKYDEKGYWKGWKDMHPDFEFILWNRKKIKQLFIDYPQLQPFEEFWNIKLKHFIQKCDFARYMIMYVIGGFYIDLDFICTKNISPLLKNRELLLFWEPKEHDALGEGKRLYNGAIGSIPNHPFWLEWMNHLKSTYHPMKFVFETTGPHGKYIYIKFILLIIIFRFCKFYKIKRIS
jgi:mannosyltransferase OCH1-like enzyme